MRISDGRERISSGIPFPVKKIANSLVKLLQLYSNRSYFAGLLIGEKRERKKGNGERRERKKGSVRECEKVETQLKYDNQIIQLKMASKND